MLDHAGRAFADLQLRGNFIVAVAHGPQLHHAAGSVIPLLQQLRHTLPLQAAVRAIGQGVLGQIAFQQVIGAGGGVLFAQAFQPDVARNAEQPGLDSAVPAVGVQPFQRPQEGLA